MNKLLWAMMVIGVGACGGTSDDISETIAVGDREVEIASLAAGNGQYDVTLIDGRTAVVARVAVRDGAAHVLDVDVAVIDDDPPVPPTIDRGYPDEVVDHSGNRGAPGRLFDVAGRRLATEHGDDHPAVMAVTAVVDHR